jgi:hypothetical protein
VNDEAPRRIGGWLTAESIAKAVGYQVFSKAAIPNPEGFWHQ